MPTVLITGLNGFVGVHTAIKFLFSGWSVRGTVRSSDKGDETLSLASLKKYVDEGKLTYVVLPDLVKGDYGEALDGVEGVVHTASPWHMDGKKWEEYREPAVEGTKRLIKQVAKVSSVKALAIVSSFAAVGDTQSDFTTLKDVVYTEEDWAPMTEQEAEKMEAKEDGSTQAYWYATSKKLAEQTAWETHKSLGPKFVLGTVCPPFILGPSYHLHPSTSPDTLDTSTSLLFHSTVSSKHHPVPTTTATAWVDVRDVAEALYQIISRPISGRYLLCGGEFDFDIVARTVAGLRPDLKTAVPQRSAAKTPSDKGSYKLDVGKAKRELGIEFTSLEKTVEDSVKQFEQLDMVIAPKA
ncbi:hypothetical protein M231_02311 [Tremella mesenterica]|uniref:Thioester reductase (TE) domain-containing protein n=1 Tax=Tremella mesenterica TaxID=5217 RepID=A0A4Q1BRA2_TREME|nr:uncharacterized protein TREMEDRAFT_65378 [Tremella mesenterica DSM 1558]EIW66511.1 hypothetical protein TREMEDRAFT_65378 [Tremella mesenterica DSM 1558]RXK40478.1 hypothetical protein M231_02311 [Tremella mesenterica]